MKTFKLYYLKLLINTDYKTSDIVKFKYVLQNITFTQPCTTQNKLNN